MKEEIDALMKNETLDLVPKLKDAKPVSCKWVYRLKRKADGSIDRYKARLVARGFSQKYGEDYDLQSSSKDDYGTLTLIFSCKLWMEIMAVRCEECFSLW